MTIHRTAMDSGLATIPQLNREQAATADKVAVYSRPGVDGIPTVIIECTDLHGNLIARSVVETTAEREAVASSVLVDSQIEMCGQWRIDPIHRRKRSIVMVALRASDRISDFEIARGATQRAARTA